MLIKIEAGKGCTLDISPDMMDDWEFIKKTAALSQSGTKIDEVAYESYIIDELLPEAERKKLMDALRQENGRVKYSDINRSVLAISEALRGDGTKNS